MIRRRGPRSLRTLRYAFSFALAGGMTLLIGALVTWTTGGQAGHQGQLYLLPVLAAGALLGRGPAVLTALLSFLAFNWFFVTPVHTLTVADAEEWQALLLYLAVALVTGELTARLSGRAEAANRREREAVALHDVGQALSASGTFDDGLAAAETGLRRVLGDVELRLVLADESGLLPSSGEDLDPAEAAVVSWVMEHQSPAERGAEGTWHRRVRVRGPGTGGGPRGSSGAEAVFLPLVAGGRCLGVLRVTGRRERLRGEERRLLTSTADQLALALDRARLQRQMVRTEVQRQTDELRSAMLLAVSHDFRTPLAAIKAAAGTLHDDGFAPELRLDATTRDAAAEQVEREADRLNRLVENLLGLSRIEAGALRLDRQWYPLRELVDDTAARLAGVLIGRRLTVDVPDDLPPVPLDYVLVQQVLANLLDNAAKHTPAGSEIRVEAQVQAEPHEVVVRVVDSGPGVPATERERVFAPFYRLPSTGNGAGDGRSSVPRGSGYGLAVCAGFIAAHGGRIWVEDSPTGGAAFAFALPLTPPPAPPVEADEPPASGPARPAIPTEERPRPAPRASEVYRPRRAQRTERAEPVEADRAR